MSNSDDTQQNEWCSDNEPIFERGSSDLRWSPNANLLAFASFDADAEGYYAAAQLLVLNTVTHQKEFTHSNSCRPVYGLGWSPDSRRLVATDNDGIVRIWDTANWQLLGYYRISTMPLLEATWHPNDNRLAVAGADGIIYVLNPNNGQVTDIANIGLSNTTDFNTSIGWLVWSPDGTKLGVGRAGGEIQILDSVTFNLIRTIKIGSSNPADARWSPNGSQIVTNSDDYEAQLWDVHTGTKLLTLTGHTSYINGMAWSPSGKLIATTSDDATIRIWDAVTGEQKKVFTPPDGSDETLHIDWSINGKIAYSYAVKSYNGIEPQQIIPQIISYPDSVK